MKIVINKCYGGYSISPEAVRKMAEYQGRDCYFFESDFKTDKFKAIDNPEKSHMWFAFDIPNPNEILLPKKDKDGTYKTFNKKYEKHELSSRPDDRTDKLLIKVIEELGSKADGQFAKLKIVEIPDGTNYEIDEYDGLESIHEVHNVWS